LTLDVLKTLVLADELRNQMEALSGALCSSFAAVKKWPPFNTVFLYLNAFPQIGRLRCVTADQLKHCECGKVNAYLLPIISGNAKGFIKMELGTIQNVSLKSLWPGEATHFTPWLANNLDVLAKKLGIDLELVATEVSAGDFSADIIARDLSRNRLVVIENQFGGTDHKHLGQLLTYSSVLGAGAVVWIAETIRPEHKSAIDFLNLNLKESLSIYAIEASAVRIDNSKPAFLLNVVSMPSEASIVTTESRQQPSETKEKYRNYFQSLIDELREKHYFTNARAGQPQNWYTFASENSKLYKYSANFCQGGKARVEVYIDCGDKARNEEVFDCLHKDRDGIARLIESELSWERLDNRRACRIAVYRDGDIDMDSEELTKVRDWTIRNLLKFKEVFPEQFSKCEHEMIATKLAV
jgi:hypothetical protein